MSNTQRVIDPISSRHQWLRVHPERLVISYFAVLANILHEINPCIPQLRVVPEQSMALRDLVRGGDPVGIAEWSSSRNLRKRGPIPTRLIPCALWLSSAAR